MKKNGEKVWPYSERIYYLFILNTNDFELNGLLIKNLTWINE